MPITSVHPDYKATLPQWQRCRDAVDGADAIKARGATYLPMLSGQSALEYEAYKLRALWYGATARTVQGLTGAVMRKPPTVTAPEALTAQLQDVTRTGVPIEAFAKLMLQEVLTTGRYGLLVDMPPEGTGMAARPYWVGYPAERVTNWHTEVQAGQVVLTMVVLSETVFKAGADPFEPESIEQYRVLRLDDQRRYTVDLYRKQKEADRESWVKAETLEPTFRGQRLDYIPFCIIGPSTATPAVEKSPILDLVDVNLSHYRSSADLEHGRHFCGLPTPWVAGFPADTELKIGSSVAWVSSDPDAHAGMLEFTGQGLGALERALESKERLMAVLGARLLEEAKRTVEAADTLAIRYSGERSVLQSIAASVGIGLTQALRWHAVWAGLSERTEQAQVTLNSDFVDAQMTASELTALFQTYQGGGMSYETFYYNLQRGEIARPGVDAETERALIEAQQPNTFALPEAGAS